MPHIELKPLLEKGLRRRHLASQLSYSHRKAYRVYRRPIYPAMSPKSVLGTAFLCRQVRGKVRSRGSQRTAGIENRYPNSATCCFKNSILCCVRNPSVNCSQSSSLTTSPPVTPDRKVNANSNALIDSYSPTWASYWRSPKQQRLPFAIRGFGFRES